MYHETHTRSVIKAVSWRILGTLATSTLVFLFTRQFALSLAVGGLEFLSKIGLFWLHERAWDRVRLGKREPQSAVLWFTGLSGSGKSTIAQWVSAELRQRGHRVEHLDGDSIRHLFPTTGFSRPERDEHVKRVGFLASKLEQNGVVVVASFVSPYAESRAFVRGLCRNFIEIHVDTPLAECERRDVKGLYAKARRGEIANFTGIGDPYEAPENPEVRLDTTRFTVEEAGAQVLERMRQQLASSARATHPLAAVLGRRSLEPSGRAPRVPA
jgi:adenylylsulfate kinase